MRVADYIFQTLAAWGVRHVFFVSGGGAMHLNDALGKTKNINYVCNLHEQACAMAAEGYARISGMPGVVCVTTGPGGTNALTGVAGAWLDSIPMVIISGQVKTSMTVAACPELHLRQLGDQELNIVDVVRPITKYAKMITAPEDIVGELSKAWNIAQEGRPGPVWLDIPLNIQAATLEDRFVSQPRDGKDNNISVPLIPEAGRIAELMRHAVRPVILAGNGVRLAHAEEVFIRYAEKLNIPVLTDISGVDLIASDHPLFMGRPGILGERPANYIVQNADLLLVLGSRMGIRLIGYAFEQFAANACKIMVDVDYSELNKPTFVPDVKVHADLRDFLAALERELPCLPPVPSWIAYCEDMKKRYPVILPKHRERTDYVSSYVLPELIAGNCKGTEIIVTGNGTAYTSTFQAFPLKRGMRMFANQGCASMGYGLPAAIGAAFAGNGREVLCLTGDGSIQMNLQELQTVKNYHLPLKIFVYNNAGYLSIKLTQKAFFAGNYVGSTAESGIVLPDLQKIAMAYDLPFFRLEDNAGAARQLPHILQVSGPAIIEVMTDPFEELEPKAASRCLPDGSMISLPLHDLAPFLPPEELERNMIPVKSRE